MRKLPLGIALLYVAFVELEDGQKNRENDTIRPSKCNWILRMYMMKTLNRVNSILLHKFSNFLCRKGFN